MPLTTTLQEQGEHLEQILTSLKDTNALIDPQEVVRLIEEVGMLIDDLDLEIIELEEQSNLVWARLKDGNPEKTVAVVEHEHKLSGEYKNFRRKSALLKSLRRHYRLLNTKLNLLTKPKGR